MNENRVAEIRAKAAPAPVGPYSQAIAAGGFVFCSGQIGLDLASGELASGGVEAEARQALANLVAVLAAAGVGPKDVVRTDIFLRDLKDFGPVNAVYAEVFNKEPRPARQTVESPRLPKGASVEISCIALSPSSPLEL